MKLGAFSISIAVKDLAASRSFYEQLGFHVFAGGSEKNYYIMKNADTLIGIFHGMFEGSMMTFNPGWDQDAKTVDGYDDVRNIQQKLKNAGIPLMSEVDADTSGPGGFMFKDPDGNIILIDQHI